MCLFLPDENFTPCWINIPGMKQPSYQAKEWDVFCRRHHRQILSFVPWRLGLGWKFLEKTSLSNFFDFEVYNNMRIYILCHIICHINVIWRKSNRHPATRMFPSLQGMVPFGEFTAILASRFMAITARKKSRSHQRGAKNWVKGGYHGGNQLIWGNSEWADAPGMRGQEGTGRCYTRRTVPWATGILASNEKADMASSKLRYWSWFPCVYVHPDIFLSSWHPWIMK